MAKKTTINKRYTINLTKEDVRSLDELMAHFEENSTQVIKRALILTHYITFAAEKTSRA